MDRMRSSTWKRNDTVASCLATTARSNEEKKAQQKGFWDGIGTLAVVTLEGAERCAAAPQAVSTSQPSPGHHADQG
eukprot:1583060-Rhodomonas_salina.2